MTQIVNTPIFRFNELNVPFIEALFRSQEGEMTPGYFLIDTGSMYNILSSNINVLD